MPQAEYNYHAMRTLPGTRDLFAKSRTTLRSLQDAIDNGSGFMALDTEFVHVPSCDGAEGKVSVLLQVGLAYLPTIPTQDPHPRRPVFREVFSAETGLQALTLNIRLDEQTREHVIKYRNLYKHCIPCRQRKRFGSEQDVDLEDLESAVVDFIESCSSPGTDLVLVGWGMAAEWKHLVESFPRAVDRFSSWMDIHTIKNEKAPFLNVTLEDLQVQVGYRRMDIRNRYPVYEGGKTHNAGDDAVATLAVAQALLYPRNQKDLQFESECARIAKAYARRHETEERKKATKHTPFAAAVRISGKGPYPWNRHHRVGGVQVARCFYDFKPIAAGVESKEVAVLAFASQEDPDYFIQITDQHWDRFRGVVFSVSAIEGGREVVRVKAYGALRSRRRAWILKRERRKAEAANVELVEAKKRDRERKRAELLLVEETHGDCLLRGLEFML